MSTNTIYTHSCQFCGNERKNKNSLNQHEIRCKLNPNRIKINAIDNLNREKRTKSVSAINLQYCSFCNKECKNKMSLSQHEKRCEHNPLKIDMSKPRISKINKPYCRFCSQPYSKKSINKHEIWCDKNPNLDFVKEYYESGKRHPNQYIKAKMLGLEIPKLNEEQRNKISQSNKKYAWTEEHRLSHSIAMKKAVLRNPESYTKSNRGRVRHIKKYGLTFDGSWELKFYEWCLSNNIEVIDNTEFFEYTFKGKCHLYNPDFYLPEYDIFVEVKGYYDDKDVAKWSCFNKKLFVLKDESIKLIENMEFKIEHIKDNKKEII